MKPLPKGLREENGDGVADGRHHAAGVAG